MLQPPQFAASDVVLISQPSISLLLSQSAKPVAQAPLHEPAPQVTAAMLFPEHMMPQPPQFAGSTPVWTSQPSVFLSLSQSA